MINLLIIICYSASLTFAPIAQTPDTLFVQPVFVNTISHTIQNEARSIAAIKTALAWWYELAPQPIVTEILEPDRIYVENPAGTNDWLYDVLTFENEVLEIYIIANGPDDVLFYDYDAVSAPAYNAAIALEYGWHPLEITLTHELGHVLYDIPDWYHSGIYCPIDIMCLSLADAYYSKFIGCISLEYLGRPCRKTYLPALQYL